VVAARQAAWGEVFAGAGHGCRIAPSRPGMHQAFPDFWVRFFLPFVAVPSQHQANSQPGPRASPPPSGQPLTDAATRRTECARGRHESRIEARSGEKRGKPDIGRADHRAAVVKRLAQTRKGCQRSVDQNFSKTDARRSNGGSGIGEGPPWGRSDAGTGDHAYRTLVFTQRRQGPDAMPCAAVANLAPV